MDIKQTVHSAFKTPQQRAIERIIATPEKVLQTELNFLENNIADEYNKALRTIKPVRLLLSLDAFLLLKGANKLEEPKDGSRPRYRDLICHPSVFPNTDINPHQILILG